MTEKSSGESPLTIEQMVKQIMDTGSLSAQDHLQFVTLFLKNLSMIDDQSGQLNKIFDEIQLGRLHFIN
jgi:hypothetical protein